MNQTQWVGALLVLAMMVFAGTFAMNYLGGGQGRQPTPLPPLKEQLWFPLTEVKSIPEISSLDYEDGQEGHYDFWFANENAEELKVGLERTSCTCSGVVLYLVPEERKPLLIAGAIGAGGLSAQEDLPAVLGALALVQAGHQRIEEASEPRAMLRTESAQVPARSLGWFRLSWKDKKEGRQSLTATVWADQPSERKTLSAVVIYHKPMTVQPILDVRELPDESLEKGPRVGEVLCWSATRRDLGLEARLIGGRADPNAETFFVGKPRKLSPAERRERMPTTRALCAYAVPITLRGLAKDKTPIDLGPFSRRVELRSADEAIEPILVEVKGRVQGPIEVDGANSAGQVSLGEFKSSVGKTVTLKLRTTIKGLKLVLDEEATKKSASFLTVLDKEHLSSPREEGGVWEWTLRLRVAPTQAYGIFPRTEDSRYADSAIYLKAIYPKDREKGKPDRTIRVPVLGLATAG